MLYKPCPDTNKYIALKSLLVLSDDLKLFYPETPRIQNRTSNTLTLTQVGGKHFKYFCLFVTKFFIVFYVLCMYFTKYLFLNVLN